MKRILLLVALALCAAGAGAAQTDSDVRDRSGATGTTQGGSQRIQTQPSGASDDMRDAAGAPVQRQDLRRPPAAAPGEMTTPPLEQRPADQTGRRAGGGTAGLTIGAIFLALIVFILYRRSRRVDAGPYDRP